MQLPMCAVVTHEHFGNFIETQALEPQQCVLSMWKLHIFQNQVSKSKFHDNHNELHEFLGIRYFAQTFHF